MRLPMYASYIEVLKGTPFQRMKPKAALTIQGIDGATDGPPWRERRGHHQPALDTIQTENQHAPDSD